jgi:hypothetical protein
MGHGSGGGVEAKIGWVYTQTVMNTQNRTVLDENVCNKLQRKEW